MAKDKEFFHLINRAYRRAGKTWDTAEPDTMRGALGYCDVKKGVAWVDSTLDARPLNHVLLHELSHLICRYTANTGSPTIDYWVDEVITEMACYSVLLDCENFTDNEEVEHLERIKIYRRLAGDVEIISHVDQLAYDLHIVLKGGNQ